MKTLTALLTAFTLTGMAHATDVLAPPIVVEDATGVTQITFDPDASGQALMVPLAELGGSVPADLGLNVVAGMLPRGDTITLNKVSADAEYAYLYVTYNHNPANADANGNYWVQDLPTIELTAGGKTLASVWVPMETNPPTTAANVGDGE